MKKSKKKIIIVSVAILLVIGICVSSFMIIRSIQVNTQFEDKSTESSNNNYMFFEEGFTDVKVTDEKSALEAVASVAEIIGIKDAEKDLKVVSTNTIDGDSFYRMQQYYHDIPVYGKDVVLMATNDGTVVNLTSNYNSSVNPQESDTKPFNAENAKTAFLSYLEKLETYQNDIIINNVDLEGNFIYSQGGDNVLVYCLNVSVQANGYVEDYQVIEKMDDYEVLHADEANKSNQSINNIQGLSGVNDIEVAGTKRNNDFLLFDDERKITCIYFTNPDSAVTNDNISDSSDSRAVEAYRNIQAIYDFFNKKLNIRSFDNKNSGIIAALSRNGYVTNNIAQSGLIDTPYKAQRMGSADYLGYATILIYEPEQTNNNHLSNVSPSVAIDILGHEYTHRIIESIVNLTNGGLDEGISDIFGNLAQLAIAGNSDNIWDLGEDTGYPKYSMSSKMTMDNYDIKDDGHGNAHIIAHAAYLMWNGIDGNKSKRIDSDLLLKILYKSLFLLHSDATFEQYANAVYTAAYNTKDFTKQQLLCVREAFGEVGLDVGSSLSCSVVKGTTVYALTADNKKYQNYHIKIVSVDNEKVIADVDIKDDKGYKLDLSSGTYMIAIKDNQNKNGTTFYKKISLTEGTAIEGTFLNILTDFEEKQAEPATVKPTEKPAESTNTTYTAEQLSTKSMPEIVDLMGGDFRHDHSKGVDYYTDGGFYIYNDEKLPGFIFYLKWDYSVTNDHDSQSTDEIKQKINSGFYQLNFIAMHDAAKLNDSVSADMTYQEFIASYGYTVTKILPGAGFPGHALSNYNKGNISTAYVFYPKIDDSIYSTGSNTVSDDLISRYNPTIRSIVALPKKDIPAKSASEESNADVSSQSDSSADSIIMEDLLGAPESKLIELFGNDSYSVSIPESGLPKCLTYNAFPNVAFGFSQTSDEVLLVNVIDCEQTVRFTKDITSDMTGRQLLSLSGKYSVSEAYNEAFESYTVVVKDNNGQVIVFGWNDSDYMDKIPNFVDMQKIPSN